MPWQECQKMDERLRFVARLLEGEKMAVLCREFDISRQTGYKIYTGYKDLRPGRASRIAPDGRIGRPTACPSRSSP